MNGRSVFDIISDLKQKEGVPFILIGGFAVNFHQVSRNTADIDILITKENFNKIAHLLEAEGYKRNLTNDNFVQYKSPKFSLMDIDCMFVDEGTFSKMFKEGKELKIAKHRFIVPALNHLIALKLHSVKYNFKDRFGKDFPDILNLIRINRVNIEDQEFRELCLKFGNAKIYKQLWKVLK